MFSPREIDRGSKKLTSFFESNLYGKVADLGAGWGYLSKEALKLNANIKELTLFENNYSAYLASKKNISDHRASFKWASLKDLGGLGPRFNHIICNPPFHIGNTKNLDLLKSFVYHSSQLITPKGAVWMVFVSGVYFENDLKKYFNYVKSLHKDKNYCVYQLLNPKR